MSSPLSIFRKYQHWFLVVFTALLMFSFVVAPPLLDYLQSTRGPAGGDGVAVRWKHGKITEVQLDELYYKHRSAMNFVGELQRRATELKGVPKAQPFPQATSDELLVQNLVLVQKAEAMGITVSTDTVYEYLADLSDRLVQPSEYARIAFQSSNERLNEPQLIEQIRFELLAQKTRALAGITSQQLTGASPVAMTPGAAWKFYQQLNRRVDAEVLPISVASYLDRVSETPTESEITELYEQYKNQFSHPLSPEPGFRQRRKIAFDYIKADLQDYVDGEMENAKAQITDEEIKEYYDRNRELYREFDDIDGGSVEAPPSPVASEIEETTAVEVTPQQSESPPAPQPDTPADQSAAPTGDQQGSRTGPADDDLQFVSYVDDQSAAEISDNDAVEVPPSPLADAAPQDGTTTEQPAVKYKPLDAELSSEIRESLASFNARALAKTKRDELLAAASREIRDYAKRLRVFRALPQEGEKPPVAPKVQELAEKHGLVGASIPLVDAIEVQDYELGKASDFRSSFPQVAFRDEEIVPYEPRQFPPGGLDTLFLYWPIKETEAFTPELADIREDVVRAWKMKRALDLARQDAERKAETVRKQDKPLRDVLGGEEAESVFNTGQFSWMSHGNLPVSQFMLPSISQVEGVEGAGTDFMEVVFGLATGQVDVAVNEPEDTVYVVRIVSDSGEGNALREQFFQAGPSMVVNYLAERERQQLYFDWYDRLAKDMSVEWQRDPRSFMR